MNFCAIYLTVQDILKELSNKTSHISELSLKTDQLAASFSSNDMSTIVRNLSAVKKKFDALQRKSQKVTKLSSFCIYYEHSQQAITISLNFY